MPTRPFIVPLHSGVSRRTLSDFTHIKDPNAQVRIRRAFEAPPAYQLRCQAKLRPSTFSKGRLHPLVEDELPQCPFPSVYEHHPESDVEIADRMCLMHRQQLEKCCQRGCQWTAVDLSSS